MSETQETARASLEGPEGGAKDEVFESDARSSDKVSVPIIDEEKHSNPLPDEGKEPQVKEEERVGRDPNAVSWEGDDDPKNPMNWPARKKWFNMGALSIMTLLTPLGSSMFAPGVPEIMEEFHSHSTTTATFVVSVYILGFAFGPLLAAPMSETYGRAICYNIANVFFVLFTVATALSRNMGMLIVFRFLMGFAGSTPITNGSGSISDMFPVEQRGIAMAVWALGPLLGPCMGPVAGGFVVERLGWRWVFWIIAIAGGAISALCYFALVETHHPTLLRREVNRLQKVTGNRQLYCSLDDPTMTAKRRLQRAIVRPLKMLLTVPTITILSLFVTIAYGILYVFFSTFTFVFSEQYHFSTGIVGLTYVPAGIGMIIGLFTIGPLTDQAISKRIQQGLTPTPEDRLPIYLTVPGALCIPVALFWYGWSIEAKTHWIVPMLGEVVFCIGLMCVMMSVQTYLVDANIKYAASVVAALTVLRSIGGAFLPLAGLKLFDKLGLGWGNSLLAFISLACVPIPVVFRYYGASLRAKFPANFD